jgi:hypothetical protein
MRSKAVFVAGMVSTAVVVNIAHQRARGEAKHTLTISQQEASIAARLTTYQAKSVQSIGTRVSLDVHARIGLNSDKWPCERKNSVPNGYKSG